MIPQKVDVLIIGGGLVGASLALALKNTHLTTALIEAKPYDKRIGEHFDARSIALSLGSVRILNALGLWQTLAPFATAMQQIHISDKGRFGSARLSAKDYHVDALGFVVEMQYLNHCLMQALEKTPNLSLFCPATVKKITGTEKVHSAVIQHQGEDKTLDARLIVAADGAHSFVRQQLNLAVEKKEYGQDGIVANIGLQRSHYHIAYERFTSEGPLALLPMSNNRSSLVWSVKKAHSLQLMQLPDPIFLKKLQQHFGYRLGRLTKVGKRFCFPLTQSIMKTQTHNNIVFIGNAAHNLHPVAGQGFNLGLRDVAYLAETLKSEPLALPSLFENYLAKRKHDQSKTIRLTDMLINSFTSKIPGIGLARDLALMALDNHLSLKKHFMRQALGLSGRQVDLNLLAE